MAEHPGLWWLPGGDDAKVPGILTIDEDGAARLSLIGELRSPFERAIEATLPGGEARESVTEASRAARAEYPRVLGQSGRTEWTLEDGFMTSHQTSMFGGLASEELRFNQCFEGVRLDEKEDLAFDRVYASLQWLPAWIDRSGISEEVEHHEGGGRGATVFRLVSLPQERVELDGGELLVNHVWSTGGDGRTQREMTQGFAFEVRANEVLPLRDLMIPVANLQALVSMGVDRSAGYELLQISNPDLIEESMAGARSGRRLVTYHAAWVARDRLSSRQPHNHEIPFRLHDLGDSDVLRRWLDVATRYQHQLNMVMTTRYRPGLVHDRLLYRVAALEGLHRQRKPQKLKLSARLEELAQEVGTPFAQLVDNPEGWIRAVVMQRNHVSHGSAPEQIEGRRLLLLGDAAYWLFVWTLLQELHVPEGVFDRCLSTPNVRWLAQQLQALPLGSEG